MKKIVCLLLFFSLVFALVACNANQNGADGKDGQKGKDGKNGMLCDIL